MSSNSRTLFGGEIGNNFFAQSLVREILASDDKAGTDLINQLIQRKKFVVLAEAAKIIKGQMDELSLHQKSIETSAIDAFPLVKDTTVHHELWVCFTQIRIKRDRSFVPKTPELQDEGSLQILKDHAVKLVSLAEQKEKLAEVHYIINNAVEDAAMEKKFNEKHKPSCSLL